MNTDLDGFNSELRLGKQKEALDSLNLTNEIIITWLGIRFEERELYNKAPNEASIERIKELLESQE